MEIVIRNVQIVDGSGGPFFDGDVGIQDGLIAYVGSRCPEKGTVEVSGAGLVAAPGFVDIHSHSDYYLLVNPLAESKVRQGVTTEIGGNCGYSAAILRHRFPEKSERRGSKPIAISSAWNFPGRAWRGTIPISLSKGFQ